MRCMTCLPDSALGSRSVQVNESPSIKSKMDDVAEAVAAVKRDLIGELPKMRRARSTDVSDLWVTVNELTPVSEPLYAAA